MNIDATTIYLWQLADEVRHLFSGATLLSVIGAIAFSVFYGILKEDRSEALAKSFLGLIRASIATLVLSAICSTFIPTSKTIAMMVVLPKIVDSKVIQQDLPDIYNAAMEALKAALKP